MQLAPNTEKTWCCVDIASFLSSLRDSREQCVSSSGLISQNDVKAFGATATRGKQVHSSEWGWLSSKDRKTWQSQIIQSTVR